ncbi:MAG: DUF5343 domain-containing protein [Planctomycetota bacterium]|jgi:hypothetical protein
MSAKLPYVVQPGTIKNIFEKIKSAKTPERFTHDFLSTKLGFKGGNAKQFIPLAKKMKFLSSDGKTTDLYSKFRNSATTGAAMAEGTRNAYGEVFERNEYANDLSDPDFKGLVIEITGLDKSDRVTQLTCQTFNVLRKLADFEKKSSNGVNETKMPAPDKPKGKLPLEDLGLNLSYSINLVLPKTDDPAVFNAIFRALRDNLLGE